MNDIDPRVLPDSPPVDSEVLNTEPQKEVEVAAPTEDTKPPKGYVPSEALAEERRRRKELEVQIEELKATTITPDEDVVESDEGRVLKQEIRKLERSLEEMREERELEAVVALNPQIADKRAEFDEYRKEYPKHKLQNVAKLFLAESGLLEGAPDRKGLERPTGGSKAPAPSTPSEDIRRIRETQPRRYIQMLREGKINPDDIK